MSNWRVAKSLDRLLAETNQRWPDRDKKSDGAIGDAAHATRQSDHNPWVKDSKKIGVVTARDFTEDKQGSIDEINDYVIATIIKRKDPRVKYLIHEGRIWSGTGQAHPAWKPRVYSGPNAHKTHLHVSVKPEARFYDDGSTWGVYPAPASRPVSLKALKRGWSGEVDGGYEVRRVQRALNKVYGLNLVIDGDVGPKTRAAWKVHQKALHFRQTGNPGRVALTLLSRKAGFKVVP